MAVPLADYLVDDAPMAAELEVLFVQPPGCYDWGLGTAFGPGRCT